MANPTYPHNVNRPFTQPESIEKGSLLDKKILFERVDVLYRLALVSLTANLVNMAIIVIGLWDSDNNWALVMWAASVVVVVGLRYLLVKIYGHSSIGPDQARRWEYFFSVGALLMGSAWAALIWGFFPQADMPHRLMLLIVLAGMMAGSAGTLASSRLAYFCFNLPPTVVLVVLMFSIGDQAYSMVGLLVLVFATMQARVAAHYWQAINQVSISFFSNRALLEQVQQTEKKLTDAIESFPDGFALFDTQDRLILCNSKYVAAHGKNAGVENLVGKKFSELARMAVEEGEVTEAEAGNRSYYLRGDTQGRGSIQMSRQGDTITIHSDSMRTSAAEKSLKQMKLEQTVLLAISPEAIALIQNGIVVGCNLKLEQLLGYSPGKLSQKALTANLLSNQFSANDSSAFFAELHDGNTHQGKLNLLKKDGSILRCNYNAKAVDPLDLTQTTIWIFTETVI